MAAAENVEHWPRDVFVLGAGFSRAVSYHLPVTSDLFDLSRVAMRDLELEVADQASVMDAFQRFGRNIETWLTWLGSDQPWLSEASILRNRAAFGEVAQALALTILRTQNRAVAENVQPWFIDLVRAWNNRGQNVTVITLNYDALVEKLFETVAAIGSALLYSFMPVLISGAARYGGPQTSFRLLKLHGSITWYIYPPTGSGESIYGPIYDAGLLSQWRPDPEGEIIARVGARRALIVPPVLTKDPYFGRPELREQWLLADHALRHAERLYIVGYSVPEADLAMRFLLDRTHPKSSVSVIDRDAVVGSRVEGLLDPRKVDLTFTGRDSVVEEFVRSYVVMHDGNAT